jgi:hypothetical protein
MPRRTLPPGAEFMFGDTASVESIPGHFAIFGHFDHERNSNRPSVQSGKFLGGLDVLDQ